LFVVKQRYKNLPFYIFSISLDDFIISGFILTFVYRTWALSPNNKKKTMQIHNNTLIAECSSYDFKEMLERKKVKSWLKSVSAFANTDGGSLFYGVNDDGVIVGLENPQADADFISEMIKARLDPVPEVQLIPIEHEGRTLLEVRVKAGTLTPYYYYQDGTRTAYTRVGNESVECNSQQLLSLVLKGTHMTWDSLPTQVDANKHSFVILANTFLEQTHQEWNDKYLESFGLVTSDGKLTNAGLLFVDNCTVFQSRIFCTRWTGLYKDDAISSVEHRANLVLLLKYGMDFIKNYTMSGWVKMPNYRLNLPDYSDRAIFEGLVNHLIHRDYTVMGGEVHIDIYDDRVELVSPGAMLDGTQIQDRDIYKVPSMRRNPVIADMFTQLDYMEKRGSGLRKMRELTEKLPNFLPGKEPQYQTEAISFYTTFYNLNWGENGRIPIEEVANRVNSSFEKYSIDEESSVKTFGDLQKSSVKTFGDLQNSSVKQKRLGRTAQSILDLVISDGSISQDKMAEKIGVSKRAIEMQIANLKAKGLLVREGADHGGYWRIVINPKAEE
jgi:ATP-dependent DNA helicase RecG